jgi:hypothetical protein
LFGTANALKEPNKNVIYKQLKKLNIMKAIKGIIAYSVENGNLHVGNNFTTYKYARQKWNSRRRFT